MLLHETDSNRGGAPMDQMLADCPDDWREEIFVSRRPIIPWLRVKEFKIVTLKMIVSSMLLHQSKIERKLQARSTGGTRTTALRSPLSPRLMPSRRIWLTMPRLSLAQTGSMSLRRSIPRQTTASRLVHIHSRCEWLPTAPEGRQEKGATTPPPATDALAVSAQGIQLAGNLYRRLPTTGMYKRVEVVIEGATLCCGTSGALPSALPSVVLSGSNVERLEENRAKLEFTLLTKKNGPEHGRVYAFRASTCANAKYGNVCD